MFFSHSQRTWPSIDAYKMLEKNKQPETLFLHWYTAGASRDNAQSFTHEVLACMALLSLYTAGASYSQVHFCYVVAVLECMGLSLSGLGTLFARAPPWCTVLPCTQQASIICSLLGPRASGIQNNAASEQPQTLSSEPLPEVPSLTCQA